MPEQRGIGAPPGQRDADAGRGLDDPRGDLDQPQAEGGELGGSERGGLRQRLAQAPHQQVGCGVEEEPHLVGFVNVTVIIPESGEVKFPTLAERVLSGQSIGASVFRRAEVARFV